MTKNLDAAIELMEGGWCIGDLKGKDAVTGKDKFCAVGAVAQAAGVLELFEEDGQTDDKYRYYVDEDATYANFKNLPEAKALADEVMSRTEWLTTEVGEAIAAYYAEGDYDSVVFNFNDTTNKDEVIQLFKDAKKRL